MVEGKFKTRMSTPTALEQFATIAEDLMQLAYRRCICIRFRDHSKRVGIAAMGFQSGDEVGAKSTIAGGLPALA